MGKAAAPEGRYEAKDYWSERLKQDFSLAGVGYRAFGEKFNRWQYRAYLRNLQQVERRFGLDFSKQSILECGLGTGFFLDYYHRRGNRSFAGVDLTQISVDRIRARYPGMDFRQADLGAGPLDMGRTFDVVTAFAVLLHITDEQRFQQALANLGRNSRQYVLISDVFPVRRYEPNGKAHYVLRSHEEYRQALATQGFEVAGMVPIFALLSSPSPWPKWWFNAWNAVLYALSRTEFTGNMLGAICYSLDGFMIPLGLGHSNKLLVAKRITAA